MSNSLVENQNYFQKKETKRSRKQIADKIGVETCKKEKGNTNFNNFIEKLK